MFQYTFLQGLPQGLAHGGPGSRLLGNDRQNWPLKMWRKCHGHGARFSSIKKTYVYVLSIRITLAVFLFFFLCNTPVTFLELFISCLHNARGNWIGQLVVKRNSAFDTLSYYLCWLSFVISFGCCTCPYICAPKWNLVCSSDSEFLNICPTMANTRIYIYMNLYESIIVSAGKYKLPNNYLSLSLSAYFPKKNTPYTAVPILSVYKMFNFCHMSSIYI